MKKLLISSLFLGSLNYAYAAESMPNLVGEWTAETVASVYGAGAHHPGEESKNSYRTHPIKIQFTVEEQRGNSFHGKVVSSNFSERMVGSIAADGKSGVMTDEDGSYQFKIVGKNKIDYCYSHTTKTSMVAACVSLTRK